MGGERFEANHQDVYLFGENDDLNFLGSRPVPVGVIPHLLGYLRTCCAYHCPFLSALLFKISS